MIRKMNKKGGGIYTLWAEMLAFFLLILGFIFSLTTVGSTIMSYLVIFLWGFMFGRLWFRTGNTFRFPFFIIILGFLIGYVLASMIHGYGTPILLTAVYIIGLILSNWLHSAKQIHGVDY